MIAYKATEVFYRQP